MKSTIIITVFFALVTSIQAQVSIIPQPLNIEIGQGNYRLTAQTHIVSNKANEDNARYLQSLLEPYFKKSLSTHSRGNKGIMLQIDEAVQKTLGGEGYVLETTKDGVKIVGSTPTGVFYGIQSLKQMLPLDASNTLEYDLPFVKIEDKPRFGWRAFMLDEARYFKGMDQVKKLLDQMALLKMNVFHWHLTDDQGWRIEIKKYPLLTEVGSKRSNTQVGGWNSEERSGESHSGYYTQAQIKEIVDYASQRQITIIPEIEMPGHASAAIAAYPWLGTIGKLKEVPVVFGKLDDSFNVADPRVYGFIEEVLSEVMALFPAKTIHIGGDEVRFDAWKESDEVQQFMKEKGLQSPADLQIYFTNKVSNYIDENGHRMMGWNEILGGDVHEWQKAEDVKVTEKLAPSAIIHFWKGNTDLINEAVTNGYDIVNSYHEYTYLDYGYNYISLEKAYGFNPIPADLDPQYHHKVLGCGCQMWSEWIPEVRDLDRMVFPRLAAYAEVGWTDHQEKDYSLFREKLDKLLLLWERSGIQVQKFE
ncbi:beta-N-acetylhexosaminidase [Carboxylicivirga sp. M1479]|uniref:beta-N-acetylhexosaminidase n=1 Tax=Carboxylicivirga sp. M1479 TaxID=2594476 RepID=UPI0011786E43|nr:beta-N-acetylhexosaminidase [Carboxylicivirga sp. M1479]TRX71239.1 beta-N-acetylhexosaminidase [Carboxylicivirga sp. M1479]